MPSLPLGKCFPKPYVNPCKILIHFVGFSFHQFEWNEHTKDDELKLILTIKKSGCQFTQKKNRANVCKTLCPQHLLAPKYGQVYTVPYFHKKNWLCRNVKQVIYSSFPFQTVSSTLADKVETPFAKSTTLEKFCSICSNVNQVIYPSTPISWASFKPLAQKVFEISCWQV